jgi:hypothetical protein
VERWGVIPKKGFIMANNFVTLFSHDFTFEQLEGYMKDGQEVMIDAGFQLVCGPIKGICREDGSGKCWLLNIANKFDGGKCREAFIRTK